MQFQYFLMVNMLFKNVLPNIVESHCFQSGNVSRCPMFQVQDEFPELENEIRKRPLIKTISEKEKSLVNGITNTVSPTTNGIFETGRELNNFIHNSFKQMSEEINFHSKSPPAVDSKPIVSKLLSQSREIGLDSSNKLWLNFPLQVGLEIENDNNKNTLYRIKSLSSDDDCFDFENLFHGREYSTTKIEPRTLITSSIHNSFSSTRTPKKINPATRLHFPFHLKPPLQMKDPSVSPSSVNNNFKATESYGENVTRPVHSQPNFTMTQPITISETSITTVETTKSNRDPVHDNTPSIQDHYITSSSPPTELPITVGSQVEYYKSTTKKIPNSRTFDQQSTTLWNNDNIDIPYLNNLNLPTITNYPDIDHEGIRSKLISKLKDFLKRKFGKHVTPPTLYSGFDLEGFLDNHDLQNFNVTLPFSSIEAITLPQAPKQFSKKLKIKKFLGRIFGNSTVTDETIGRNKEAR